MQADEILRSSSEVERRSVKSDVAGSNPAYAAKQVPIRFVMSIRDFHCSECGRMPEGGCHHWKSFQNNWKDFFENAK